MDQPNLSQTLTQAGSAHYLGQCRDIWTRIQTIRSDDDLTATLHQIARSMVQVLGEGDEPQSCPPGVVVWAYDHERQALCEEPLLSIGPDAGPHLPRDAGWQGFTARYPLVFADQTLGVMIVRAEQRPPISPAQSLALDNLANLTAVAIYRAWQAHGADYLQRKVGELEQLRRADMLISSRLQLDETLQEILRIGLEMTGAEYGSFRLLDKQRRCLVLRAIAGRRHEGPPIEELPLDEGSVMGWVAIHRQPLRIADLAVEPWSNIYRPLAVDRKMRSELAVPLLGAGGGVEGILNIESPAVAAFTKDDERLLMALATQAVIAIQEIRLLDVMQEIVEGLLVRSREELFQLIIDRACDLLNAPVGAIWTLDPDDAGVLVLQKASGGHRRGDRLPVEDSLTGKAVLTKGPMTCPDVRCDPSFHYQDLAQAQHWLAALIVPLLARDGTTIGAISVYTTEPREFSDWDKKLLTCLANHAALAIQDAAQLEQLKLAQERQAVAETFAAVGDIAANLLHQLNNKIGTIPVRVQGIREKGAVELENEYLAANLQQIEDSARAALEIVRESMFYLRPIRLEPLCVGPCLSAALPSIEMPAGVELTVEKDVDRLPPVTAGEQQLVMVFLNLIENALDAMGERGRLRISGRAVDHWVEVSVADTGPGIPPELYDRIFEFSFSTRTSPKRLGFGLWWVKMFVQRFGGSVRLESTVGEGSTFTVRLPRADAAHGLGKEGVTRWTRMAGFGKGSERRSGRSWLSRMIQAGRTSTKSS